MKKTIAVIGDARVTPGEKMYQMAYEVGKALVDAGYRVQTGGVRGVMEAASKGAHASECYREGDVIAVLPFFDPSMANKYADIVISTGLDVFRNVIVANASAVIAVGGGAGTLSEMANAWTLKRLIVGMTGCGGWSEKMAGKPIDERVRYADIPEDKVYPAENAEEALAILQRYIDRYSAYHKGIQQFGDGNK